MQIGAPIMDAGKRSSSSDRWGFRRCLSLRKAPVLPKPDGLNPPIPPPTGGRKKGFSLALRKLGCASSSSSQAYDPAAAQSSAEQQDKRRERQGEEEEEKMNQAAAEIISRALVYRSNRELPRIPRPAFMGSPPPPGTPLFLSDLVFSGRFRRLYGYHHPSMDDFEEVIMPSIYLGGMNASDSFKDWRLDVDSMSYEELLELGDKIGYVSTGLEEKEIFQNLSKMEYSVLDNSPLHLPTEMECKCSICQEEYVLNDELGKLNCGHSYHMHCIKDWLLQKNACPVCKTSVTRT